MHISQNLSKNSQIIKSLYSGFLENNFSYSTDTRTIKKDDIFIALVGENFDGNQYAKRALEKDAQYIIVSDLKIAKELQEVISKENLKNQKNQEVIFVEDTLEFYREFAKHHRDQFNIPVIAIAGSNGKTTTKELLTSVFGQSHTVYSTRANDNNEIGVAQSLLNLREKHQFAIIETGTNTIGELGRIIEMCNPTHGIITNIGKEHLEFFGNIEGVMKEEGATFENLAENNGVMFAPKSDAMIQSFLEKDIFIQSKKDGKIIVHEDVVSIKEIINEPGVGIENSNYLNVELSVSSDTSEEPDLDDAIKIKTNLFGSYNIQNIEAVASIALHFGISIKDIKKGIEGYVPENMRSQIVETEAGNTVIFDCYNANPGSVPHVLDSFKKFEAFNKKNNSSDENKEKKKGIKMKKEKIVILGDMLEMGETGLAEHQSIVEKLKGSDITDAKSVYLVGPAFAQTTGHDFVIYENPDSFAEFLDTKSFKNKAILIKGSKGIFYAKGVHLKLV